MFSELAGRQSCEALKDGSEVRVMCEASSEGNFGERLIRLCEHFDGDINTSLAKIFSNAHTVVTAEIACEMGSVDTADAR